MGDIVENNDYSEEYEDMIAELLEMIDNIGIDVTLDESYENLYIKACRLVGHTPVLVEDVEDPLYED